MPISPGEHADILRAVGRFLDEQSATDVELVNQDAFLSLSWTRGGMAADRRHYIDRDLTALRDEAKLSRGTAGGDVRGGLAEIFRTLGQDLDQDHADFTRIAQQGGTIIVSGSVAGRYSQRRYPVGDLLASSRRRRVRRGGPAPRPTVLPIADLPSQRVEEDGGPLSRRLHRSA